jgi:hypothetical protein
MSEGFLESRVHARKIRIRQRLYRHHDGRKPFKLTRGATFEMATGLMLLALLGAAALH